jgi:hypothetical protein
VPGVGPITALAFPNTCRHDPGGGIVERTNVRQGERAIARRYLSADHPRAASKRFGIVFRVADTHWLAAAA